MRKQLSWVIDALFALVVLTIAVNSGCDLYYHFRGDKAEKGARFCSRLCWSEFDTDLINIGIDGQKVICNCKLKDLK